MTSKVNKAQAMLEKQKREVRVRANIIGSFLEELKSNKLTPRNRTAISKILADRVSKAEGRVCSYTTILRNETYKSLIDGFMKHCGYAEQLEKKDIQRNLLSAQLEIRELRKECAQLMKLLKKSQSDIALLEYSTNPMGKRNPKPCANDASENAFKVIRILLNKLELVPDHQLGVVVDEYDGSIVFNKESLPAYFEWLKTNEL